MNSPSPSASLRQQSLEIWNAGVDAVRADRLVAAGFEVNEAGIIVDDVTIPFDRNTQVTVVGAGKAGAGMAAGLESAFGDTLINRLRMSGWINIPEMSAAASRSQRPLRAIHLHPARPAGCNEPTVAAVLGTQEILRRVASLNEDSVCIALISGGGSALLPAPIDGIS